MHGEIEFKFYYGQNLLNGICCYYGLNVSVNGAVGGGGCKYTTTFVMKKVKTFVNVYNNLS